MHHHIPIPLVPIPVLSHPAQPGMAPACLGPIPLHHPGWSGPALAHPIYPASVYVQLHDAKLPFIWNYDTDPL